ncbi:unnamed protein product [Caenorhabditis sp. 36 PRJEB53466]|nr:unnamed protein product [Caenorhabditis sp. 36 PRJEB53466]
MIRATALLGALLVIAASAEYGVPGVYDNLPLESATLEFSGYGSGSEQIGNDSGSGADSVAIDTDCSTKEDGLYAIGGCSPQFLTCSGGIARIMDCPANLIYDHRIVACEYTYNVPECNGGVPSTEQPEVTTAPADDVPAPGETTVNPYAPAEDVTTTVETTVNPYAAAEVPATTAPANDVPAPEETTVNPYAPAEDVTTTVETTVNPYAAAEVPATTAPANDVPAPEETTVNPYAPAEDVTTTVETTVNPYAAAEVPATAAPASDEPVTRSAVERNCVNQADGFYSYGECSGDYTACSNGYTIPMKCPADLAFDEARVICDYRSAVPECQNGSGNDEGSAEQGDQGYGSAETVPAADEPSTTLIPYAEETTVAEDVPTTADVYAPVVEITTPAPYSEETTVAADVPSTTEAETTTISYVEETTTLPYAEETTIPYVEETTTAADVPSTVPYVEETTTSEVYASVTEDTTTEADVPSTTEEYTTEVVDTTPTEDTPSTTEETIVYPSYTTAASQSDVPVEVSTIAEAPVEVSTENSQLYETANDVPTCTEGATAIEPCSQNYNNCVNGQEAVFTCETGLYFSPEQGACTTADQIAECHQTKLY